LQYRNTVILESKQIQKCLSKQMHNANKAFAASNNRQKTIEWSGCDLWPSTEGSYCPSTFTKNRCSFCSL